LEILRDQLRVVLVSPRNPLNIGAAARAMKNFGFTRLRVVNPYAVAFREARSAVDAGSVLQSAGEFATVGEAVADATLVVGTTSVGHRGLQQPLRRLEYGARLIRKHASSGPVALLFGSEKFGLTNEDLGHCHWLMRIPTADQDRSLNLGHAVAICLYELVREPAAAERVPEPIAMANAGEVERITQLLLEVLAGSGYTKPLTAQSTENKVRRLVRRLQIPARDAPVWLGILRQILWKISSCQ
jgi:TrmH family RNA methyltransferase